MSDERASEHAGLGGSSPHYGPGGPQACGPGRPRESPLKRTGPPRGFRGAIPLRITFFWNSNQTKKLSLWEESLWTDGGQLKAVRRLRLRSFPLKGQSPPRSRSGKRPAKDLSYLSSGKASGRLPSSPPFFPHVYRLLRLLSPFVPNPETDLQVWLLGFMQGIRLRAEPLAGPWNDVIH